MNKVELTTFRVIPGREALADEWIAVLNKRINEVTLTLAREKMHVESIFSYHDDKYKYLSWYSLQAEDGKHLSNSPHKIDALHSDYWKKCIDKTFTPIEHKMEATFLPQYIKSIIE